MKTLVLTPISCLFSICVFSQNIDSAQFYLKKGVDEKNSRLYAVAAKDFDKAILFNEN